MEKTVIDRFWTPSIGNHNGKGIKNCAFQPSQARLISGPYMELSSDY